MTTSYILQSQQELRDLKKMERDAESLIQAQAVASPGPAAVAGVHW